MVFNDNQENNTNKVQKSKQMSSSGSIINKKMGKERNFIVNRTSSNILEQGTDFSAIEYTYSRRIPKLDIINEILKRLEKIDSKLDNIDGRITNIELVQKIQGEEIKEIKERITSVELVQKIQREEIKKINKVIVLNNLKTE
ncbi:MAG: hemolysin XhlA family protein [Mycoplasmataceae bacterium]|jgi:hypothetical protein|nr:hemolysin XhlA family protein [Mycoplasmataceae bacterium]